MAIVAIFSGRFCRGEDVAAGVTERLGGRRIDEDLLVRAETEGGVTRERLLRAMRGPPPFLDRFTHERERGVAALRVALAELIQGEETLVLHGFPVHLIPAGVTHVLRVGLVARLGYRIARAAEVEGLGERAAERLIQKEDAEREHWTRRLRGKEPWDTSLYDVFLPMDRTTVEEAVALVAESAAKPAVRITPASRQAARDFLLAARVHQALVAEGHEIEVSAREGVLDIKLSRYVSRLEHATRRLETLARAVEGVKDVRVAPGTGFVPPTLLRQAELELPTKVLLVDDERDFVQTLSERLQTRNLESAVVYDGEQALEFIETEAPEVMVLDLKMPGIDGIEVLRRVKRDHPDVEVIILTGHGSEREKGIAEELGAFAYLEKPVDIDVLARTMQEAYRKVRRSRPPESP